MPPPKGLGDFAVGFSTNISLRWSFEGIGCGLSDDVRMKNAEEERIVMQGRTVGRDSRSITPRLILIWALIRFEKAGGRRTARENQNGPHWWR